MPGKPISEEQIFRPDREGLLDRVGAVMGRMGFVAVKLQDRRQSSCRIHIVIDDQDTQAAFFGLTADVGICGDRLCLRNRRQRHGEFASLARSFAEGGGGAAVQLGKMLDDGEADPQSAFGAGDRTIALCEKLEHLGELVRRDTDPVILDLEGDVFPARDGQISQMRPPGSAVPPGVGGARLMRISAPAASESASHHSVPGVKETAKSCLFWSIWVRTASTALLTTADASMRSPTQLDLAPRDAGHVEQIVDQPGQMFHLTLDDLLGPCGFFVGEMRHLQQPDGVADRREGISQLMGEHGEEFILAAVPFSFNARLPSPSVR